MIVSRLLYSQPDGSSMLLIFLYSTSKEGFSQSYFIIKLITSCYNSRHWVIESKRIEKYVQYYIQNHW